MPERAPRAMGVGRRVRGTARGPCARVPCGRTAALAFLLGLAAVPAAAQSETPAYEGPRRYGSEHGLPHNAVHALAQDSRGYLWIGTQDGLSRFDGDEFVTYRAEADKPDALASSSVTALLADARAGLWIGTLAGLHRIRDDGTFERVELDASREAPPRITALAVGTAGRLWVGTDAGLRIVDVPGGGGEAGDAGPGGRSGPPADGTAGPLRVVTVDLPSSRAGGAREERAEDGVAAEVRAVRPALDGGVWVLVEGRGRRLLRLDRDGRLLEEHPVAGEVLDFLPEADGRVWIDRRGPLTLAESGSSSHALDATAREPAGPDEVYRVFRRQPGGGVWIGTLSGVFHVADGATTHLSSAPGSRRLTDEVTDLLVDRDGDLWVGTYGGLLHWRSGRPGVRLLAGEPQGLTGVSAVAAAADGSLWVGTYGEGVARVSVSDGEVLERFQRGSEPGVEACSDYVWELLRFDGDVWAATSEGLCRVRSSGLEAFPLPPETGSNVMLLAAGGEGLHVASALGLFQLDPAGGRVRRLAGVPATPSAILVESDGTIWLGTELDDGSLLRVRGASVERWPGLAPAGIWDLHRDRRGRLWLATGQGLARFEEATGELRRLPVAPGGGSVHYSLAEDGDGRLWAGTNRGLLAYAPGASGEDSPATGGAGRAFGTLQGLEQIGNVEFNRHGAHRLADGRLLFAGMHGITLVDPARVTLREAPAASVHRIGIAGRGRDRELRPRHVERVVLRPSDHAVTFEVGPADPAGRWTGRYEYRLADLETGWIDGGPRPVARYTTVPPGDYVFRVRPAGGGEERGVAVIVLPPFWATWWFRGLLLGLIVTAGVLAYRARVRRLVEMEQMRLRIADDLHDELGSELSGIALMTGMMARRDELPADERRRLAEIESASREVAEGLRDIVWYTKPENDTVVALTARMRTLAARLLGEVDHEIRLPDDRERSLDMRVRRDLYLTFKELLHNAVRHADASRVTISLEIQDGVLELTVADDGRGFDPVRAGPGNGLASLRRRARQLGGRLEVESAPGKGTRVSLRAEYEAPARPVS